MWPWEHVVFGYVVYSLFCHAYYRDAPGGREALLVAFASVLPDLIDKPLAWQFGVFQSGYAIGHSIFFAGPLAVAAGLLARQWGRTRLGLAFAFGYLLHLVGDVIPIYAEDGVWSIQHLLWPLVVTEMNRQPAGLLDGIRHQFLPYIESISVHDPTPYHLFQVGLALFALVLWLFDGAPGPRTLYGGLVRSYAFVVRHLHSG